MFLLQTGNEISLCSRGKIVFHFPALFIKDPGLLERICRIQQTTFAMVIVILFSLDRNVCGVMQSAFGTDVVVVDVFVNVVVDSLLSHFVFTTVCMELTFYSWKIFTLDIALIISFGICH